MRLLRTIAALSAALTPLMAEAAFSRPMPGTADFPRASNPEVNVPVCFIETPGGTTFDLVSLCGTNAAPQNTNPVAGNPANAPANNPNGSTPAAAPNPNTVTRDAVGTPITTPAGTANRNNPNNANPGTSPAGTPNANPGTSPAGTPNANPGTSPSTNPNNLNPGSSPSTNPNNPNPGTSPSTNPNNLNPGSSPSTNPNNSASPTGGTAGDSNSDLVPNPNLNLPRVPPSSFGPGGVAPTRDAIDGPRQ
ncbi:hypothetical protein Osc7112_1136 [Oscillatoria nigro-viridis PCC 7112]|uniref:Uncharacterized protein n=1 Tax=Phormidium nigroviride PCC 7112 TaxID=179408 RepID=K9VEK7_9CYAN|nr:hypothetical protein [Oscillatoria nigro-viridis]AFZ05685.1 hypothetical protein Osc7112_1136 [Oscillatoria nigro-viridis PCC 7112]